MTEVTSATILVPRSYAATHDIPPAREKQTRFPLYVHPQTVYNLLEVIPVLDSVGHPLSLL